MPKEETKPKRSRGAVFVARTCSTLTLWGLVIGGLVFDFKVLLFALIAVLAVLAFVEYLAMLGWPAEETRGLRVWSPAFAVVYLGVTYWYTVSVSQDYRVVGLEIGGLFLFVFGAFCVAFKRGIEGRETLQRIAEATFGFVWIVLLFNFVTLTLITHGAFYVFYLLIVTKFTDMGAYITGTMIGKHKMVPHISPGKTWQGFFGSLVFAVLGSVVVAWLFPEKLALITMNRAIVFALVLAILAVLGDLAESVVKRSLKVKDSGRMLPGIGGALDLIDSLLFTAPIYYFLLYDVS